MDALDLTGSKARISLPSLGWLRSAATANLAVAWVCGAAFACIVRSFAVYWPYLTDYFVYDDFFFLRAVRNHSFLEVMSRAFTFPTPQPFDEVTLFWRPLIDLYFYVFRVFGIDPAPYHVANVWLHGAVGALAVLFIWRVTGSLFSGALTGLWFVVAPTYGFAVSWISQVSELAGAAFILCALISYHAYLTADRPRLLYYSGTVLFTILALLSKETTIILLVLLPALALAISADERRRSMREILWGVAPLALLSAAFAAVMLTYQYREAGEGYRLGLHMKTNFWDYLRWLILPNNYGWGEWWRGAGAALFLALGAVALLRRQRMLAFFVLWTVVAILPFTPFDTWTERRYAYLATLPFTAFVVCAVVAIIARLPRPLMLPSAALLALAVTTALVVTPAQARYVPSFLARTAAGYEAMVSGVRTLCGPMPSESHVFIVNAPFNDYGGVHTRAAVNLYYERVYAAPVQELPGLAAFIEDKCVIRYERELRRYVRIE